MQILCGFKAGGALVAALALLPAWAQTEETVPARAAPSATAVVASASGAALKRQQVALTWQAPAPSAGHLTADQLGLVINTADPYSVAVGQYYIEKRGLQPDQVLRVELPLKAVLTPEEFAPLRRRIEVFFGAQTQALALAWREPWAVNCNSITSAVAMGYQSAQCRNGCGPGILSPYFNDATAMPYSLLDIRPAMLLAAGDEASARALIDRGLLAQGQAPKRGAPAPVAWYQATRDPARNVRAPLFPPSGKVQPSGLDIRVAAQDEPPTGALVLFQTGATHVGGLERLRFAPGAVADHLTSYAGVLTGPNGQMSALKWIDAGATASQGTVSEPCNHPQKFAHPQVLLQRLLLGETVLEAYWKSVAWPAQSVFVGDPLARPFPTARLNLPVPVARPAPSFPASVPVPSAPALAPPASGPAPERPASGGGSGEGG